MDCFVLLHLFFVGCRSVVWQMGERQHWKNSVLSFYHVGFGEGTQVFSIDSKCLYLLSQLTSLGVMLQCWPYHCIGTTVQKASIEHLWPGWTTFGLVDQGRVRETYCHWWPHKNRDPLVVYSQQWVWALYV